MQRIKNGDIVRRNSDYHGVQEPSPERIAIVRHISPEVMLLEGYDSIYTPSDFEVVISMSPTVPENSPPEAIKVFEALTVIHEWNEHHPTAMAIGIESGAIQDGGTLFTLGERFDCHDPMDMFTEVVNQMVSNKQAESLKMLTIVLNARCSE